MATDNGIHHIQGGGPAPQEARFGLAPTPQTIQAFDISDCGDPNAEARRKARIGSYLGVPLNCVELESDGQKDLEAGFNVVDILDGRLVPESFRANRPPGLILANVAPRGSDVKKRWPNGTPFCSFYHQETNTTVLSTYEGRTLSVAAKLGLAHAVKVYDIPTVANSLVEDATLTRREADKIVNTQYRSLEFEPLAATLLGQGRELPGETLPVNGKREVEGLVGLVDIFGNAKVIALPEDINYRDGEFVRLSHSGVRVQCIPHLADVRTGESAVTIGSSGYGEQRFLEIVIGKGRAARELNLEVGSKALSFIKRKRLDPFADPREKEYERAQAASLATG